MCHHICFIATLLKIITDGLPSFVTCFSDKLGSKALQVGYRDKLRMVALTKQVSHGPYNASTMPAVGLFDVVGNDRRFVILCS